MAEGVFTVRELGGNDDTFEWTSDRNTSTKGGARAAPKGTWDLAGKLRNVRTDYPGAKTPSTQVLGPQHNDQQLAGRWDDRYNFKGYAKAEKDRFEAMCRRGNRVRVSFQELSFEALIVDWNFPYRRRWQIGWRITLQIHDKADRVDLSDRVPNTTKSARESFGEVNDIINALVLSDETNRKRAALESKLSTPAVDASKASMASMLASRDALADTMDQRELATGATGTSPLSPFTRIATQFRSVENDAFSVIDDLIAVRSDISMGVQTPLGVLAFEEWSRTLRFQARILMGEASKSAEAMDQRDKPDAVRVYTPFAGESLYQISRRFYGTANSWRLIADRNSLSDFELDGTELLIIPERGAG